MLPHLTVNLVLAMVITVLGSTVAFGYPLGKEYSPEAWKKHKDEIERQQPELERMAYVNYDECDLYFGTSICDADDVLTSSEKKFFFPTSDKLRPYHGDQKPQIQIVLKKTSLTTPAELHRVAARMKTNDKDAGKYDFKLAVFQLPNGSFHCSGFTDSTAPSYGIKPVDVSHICRQIINPKMKRSELKNSIKLLIQELGKMYRSQMEETESVRIANENQKEKIGSARISGSDTWNLVFRLIIGFCAVFICVTIGFKCHESLNSGTYPINHV